MSHKSKKQTSRTHSTQTPHHARKAKTRKTGIKLKKADKIKPKKTELVYELLTTILQHFPKLFDWMREIDDSRKKASKYELAAHLTACLAMFLFKAGSRNQQNQHREDEKFRKNYERFFGFSMPHGDSVHRVIALLNVDQIEQLKHKMVQTLIQRKTFHSNRFRNKWFRIAVDATGIGSYDHQRDDQCLHTTSKNGKVTWFHSVLEARLVTPQGFSISVATVWIENPEDGIYVKQDCERKAFTRLAAKLKATYPRLPILILADGLYPYQGFFDICKANQWAYCVTFKDGNLASVWEEVYGLKELQISNRRREVRYLPGEKMVEQQFSWVTEVDYQGHSLNWLECLETVSHCDSQTSQAKPITTRFVHITDLPLAASNIVDTSRTGRMRWKIENEGFNTLKNGGYAVEHQYARINYTAQKNYFQFTQMAHLINQLMTLSTHFKESFMKAKNHPTLKNLWRDLVAAMQWFDYDEQEIKDKLNVRRQFRFAP